MFGGGRESQSYQFSDMEVRRFERRLRECVTPLTPLPTGSMAKQVTHTVPLLPYSLTFDPSSFSSVSPLFQPLPSPSPCQLILCQSRVWTSFQPFACDAALSKSEGVVPFLLSFSIHFSFIFYSFLFNQFLSSSLQKVQLFFAPLPIKHHSKAFNHE